MKWRTESAKKAELKEWHKWFAWYPVSNPGADTGVWLETVERRLLYTYGWDTQHNVWEYRTIDKIKPDPYDKPQDYMG